MLKILVYCRVFVVVDIETTGGAPDRASITEIAILRYDGERLVDQFHSLIRPDHPIPSSITALTGIDWPMVADAPSFDELAPAIFDRLQGAIFVAHNAHFDFSFLHQAFQRLGIGWTARRLCTVRLGRKLLPGKRSYSLGNLCADLGIPIEGRHRALGDASATLALLQLYQSQPGWEEALRQVKRSPAAGTQLPVHLTETDIRQLPEHPGVYQFLDETGKRLYVGKARNVRQRVRGHFQGVNGSTRRQEWLQRIHRIEVIACRTELEALIRESVLIARHWPPFNISQKQPKRQFGIYRMADGRGYTRLVLERVKPNLDPVWIGFQEVTGWAVMRHLCDTYQLPRALCQLDVQPHPASFWHALEPPDVYAERLEKALADYQQQQPTCLFVAAPESSEEGALVILMETGRFLGMGIWPMGLPWPTSSVEAREHVPALPESAWIRQYCLQAISRFPEQCVPLSPSVIAYHESSIFNE